MTKIRGSLLLRGWNRGIWTNWSWTTARNIYSMSKIVKWFFINFYFFYNSQRVVPSDSAFSWRLFCAFQFCAENVDSRASSQRRSFILDTGILLDTMILFEFGLCCSMGQNIPSLFTSCFMDQVKSDEFGVIHLQFSISDKIRTCSVQ